MTSNSLRISEVVFSREDSGTMEAGVFALVTTGAMDEEGFCLEYFINVLRKNER